jgi:hypothetical protein
MRTATISCLLGLAALTSLPASASTITMSYQGSAYGYSSGYITPNPNSTITPMKVSIGGESIKNVGSTSYDFAGPGEKFVAYCADPMHWLQSSYTYNVGGVSEMLLDGFSQSRIDDLLHLADNFLGSATDKISSAAFQVATWTILYGTPSGGSYSYGSGSTFTASGLGTSVDTLVQYYLANLDSGKSTGHYKVNYLYDAFNCTGNCSQDLVTFTPSPVPLPAALPMMLSGLAALGFASRRRKS